MIASIRYNKGSGNAAIYSRLRNVTGQFWNFTTLAWVTAEVAACRIFLSEVQDSDPAESLYAAEVLVPIGGPWIIEAVLAATGACMGGEATPPDVPTAPDNATLQALRTDFTTARAAKLDNLDASLSTRATESTAQAVLAETQSHPTLAEIEASTVLAKESSITAIAADITTVQGAQADMATGINLLLTSIGTLLDIGQGKWEIVDNQMIFYKRDATELMRFNLQDRTGTVSETEVFKRVPV